MSKPSAKRATKFEAKQIARIQKWQARRPGFLARATAFLTAPVVWTFRKIIPHTAVEATLHGNIWLARRWARERTTLRALGASSIADLTETELLHVDRVVRRIHRGAVYMAAGIGIGSGMFGFFALPVGMAAALNLALRTIHRIGLCYGYGVATEADRLFVYYTLSLAGNRAPEEKMVSLEAMRELQARIAAAAPAPAEDTETVSELVDETRRRHAFSIAHHDFSREITKQLVQVRLLTSVPIIGAAMGLFVDTGYMRSVGWAARRAYQLRWLRDRGRWPDSEMDMARA